MEKIVKEIIKKEETRHSFYCDGCNKYLGTTKEYDDCYYDELGILRFSFYLFDEWYKVEKCFCDECKKKYITEIKEGLKKLGLKQDS